MATVLRTAAMKLYEPLFPARTCSGRNTLTGMHTLPPFSWWPRLVLGTLRFGLVFDQSNHILILFAHYPGRHTLWLANDVSELTHGDAVLLLPVQDSVEVLALTIDAEIRVWLVTNIDPIMDKRISAGSTCD